MTRDQALEIAEGVLHQERIQNRYGYNKAEIEEALDLLSKLRDREAHLSVIRAAMSPETLKWIDG